MGKIVEKLKGLFRHTIVHEPIAKQASELPSKLNFLEMSKELDFPANMTNVFGERPKHGFTAELARSMKKGSWVIAPSKKIAQNLKKHIDQENGKSSGKTKTIKNVIYVWRCK